MRILYIVTAFPRSSGDVITPWLTETIQRLGTQGVSIEVLAPSYRGLGDQVIDGVTIHRFRYAPAFVETLTHDQTTPDRLRERPLFFALLPGYLIAGALAAVRLTRSHRFDAVHAFWPLPHSLFGLAARRAAGVPLISTFFGVELTWVRSKLPFLRPLLRGIIRSSDVVTVISSHTANEVRRLDGHTNIRTIPFGAVVDSAHPIDTLPRDPSVPFQLLFVGRLVERKGVAVLLRAVANLRSRVSVHLRVVGDGPLRGDLEQLANELGIADTVTFEGTIDGARLQQAYSQADVFVLPAVKDAKGDVEGLGVVLIEAQLHGTAVIASDSGGITDVVEHGQTGLLVPPGDADALADAILLLNGDGELRRQLASAGRDHAVKHFSWDAIIQQLVALYAEVSGRHSRSR